MKKDHGIDFDTLIDQVFEPTVGLAKDQAEDQAEGQTKQAEVAIWGGQCGQAAVLKFIEAWPALAEMPFRIWEYSDAIRFEEDTIPDAAEWLERGRLFGPGGDLSLRRAGDGFHWHFVGPPGTEAPALGQPKDFWTHDPQAEFHQNQETFLLWGERREGFARWFDDRAAKAVLHYPVAFKKGRVEIRARTLSRAGRVEFVWFQGLEAYDG